MTTTIQVPPPSGADLGGATPPPPPTFFSENRRGEINDLKEMLRVMRAERWDNQKQRDTIKKVIAFMTLGIDVSRLFSEMILCCATTDVVQKKMIYLYITTSAEANSELTILAVNTLQKDCCDLDPSIRGLALRSICSLRAAGLSEYFEPAVRRGLVDSSGYVRKTAVIGVLKLNAYMLATPSSEDGGLPESASASEAAPRLSQLVESSKIAAASSDTELDAVFTTPARPFDDNLLDIVYTRLDDPDPEVVMAAISVLNEVLAPQGGLAFTKLTVASLLNRVAEFSEWGQVSILNLLANYTPENEDELFDLMNILEDRLKHSSSAVVLAAAKCFLELVNGRSADLRRAILTRLRAPLLTLIATGFPEVVYVILVHLEHLITSFELAEMVDRSSAPRCGSCTACYLAELETGSQCQAATAATTSSKASTTTDTSSPTANADGDDSKFICASWRHPIIVFGPHFKTFYCHFADPVYIKCAKLNILAAITSATTAREILNELFEYVVTEVDPGIVARAIETTGILALRFRFLAAEVVDGLLCLLEVDNTGSTLTPCLRVLQLTLRRVRSLSNKVITAVLPLLESAVITHPEALSIAIWLIGEFCYQIEDAPYILEACIAQYMISLQQQTNGGVQTPSPPLYSSTTSANPRDSNEAEPQLYVGSGGGDGDDKELQRAVSQELARFAQDNPFKYEELRRQASHSINSPFLPGPNPVLLSDLLESLIVASVKVFVHRPGEMQRALGALLGLVLKSDTVSFKVRDRALYFYRFLLESSGSPSVQQLLKRTVQNRDVDEPGILFMEQEEAELAHNRSSVSAKFNTVSLLLDHDFNGEQSAEHFKGIVSQETEAALIEEAASKICYSGRFVPSAKLVESLAASAAATRPAVRSS